MRYILFIFVLLFIHNMALAQAGLIKSPKLELAPGVTNDQVEKIVTLLDKELSKYQTEGKLLNKKTGRIDRESVAAFKNLFTLDAYLFNDLRQYSQDELLPFDGYLAQARNYFENEGILFSLSDPQLISVLVNNTYSRLECTVKVGKALEKYYTAEGNIGKESRFYDLTFTYYLRDADAKEAKIAFIHGPIRKPPADYVVLRELGFTPKMMLQNFKPSNNFSSPAIKDGGTLSVDPTYSVISGALRWQSNFFAAAKSTGKNLFLAAGLGGGYYKSTIKLTDYALTPFQAAAIIENKEKLYERKVGPVTVTETQTQYYVQGDIGLGLRLKRTTLSNLQLVFAYQPMYYIPIEGVQAGTGRYDGNIEGKSSFSLLEAYGTQTPEAHWKVGKDLPVNGNIKAETRLAHAVGFSAMFYRDIVNNEPAIGIGIGLDAQIQLTSPYKQAALSDPLLRYNNDLPVSITNGYLSGLKFSSFGLRIVVYQKKINHP